MSLQGSGISEKKKHLPITLLTNKLRRKEKKKKRKNKSGESGKKTDVSGASYEN